jgi:transposase InsO family protein
MTGSTVRFITKLNGVDTHLIITGLIRYKFVIHAFVDGFSRFVTGIQVVNNNRAATVVALFHQARAKHGTPSRVRGDHGVENIEVATAMEVIRGSGRGSYIWGRSVRPYAKPFYATQISIFFQSGVSTTPGLNDSGMM